jgi:hypothetical protein
MMKHPFPPQSGLCSNLATTAAEASRQGFARPARTCASSLVPSMHIKAGVCRSWQYASAHCSVCHCSPRPARKVSSMQGSSRPVTFPQGRQGEARPRLSLHVEAGMAVRVIARRVPSWPVTAGKAVLVVANQVLSRLGRQGRSSRSWSCRSLSRHGWHGPAASGEPWPVGSSQVSAGLASPVCRMSMRFSSRRVKAGSSLRGLFLLVPSDQGRHGASRHVSSRHYSPSQVQAGSVDRGISRSGVSRQI